MKATVHIHPAVIDYWAEEYECATTYLNDRNVPTCDKDGQEYSLVGRIEEYASNKELYVKAN